MSSKSLTDFGRMLPTLFRAEAAQGWSSGMLQVVDALLAGQLSANGCLLEIGCGGGQFLHHWRQNHPSQSIYGIDLHPQALPQAQENTVGTVHLSRADLIDLPFADESFDLIVALDVLDQRGIELSRALAEARRLLKPNGRLLLRFSAYPWLYGRHDVAFNTGKRFDKEELQRALLAAGFQVQRVTHANALLAMPIIISRLLQKWGWLRSMAGLYESSLSNWLLKRVLMWEADWLQRHNLPFGVSLYVISQR